MSADSQRSRTPMSADSLRREKQSSGMSAPRVSFLLPIVSSTCTSRNPLAEQNCRDPVDKARLQEERAVWFVSSQLPGLLGRAGLRDLLVARCRSPTSARSSLSGADPQLLLLVAELPNGNLLLLAAEIPNFCSSLCREQLC